MVTVGEIMQLMEEIAPRALAEDWDNPGLLVGSPAQETEAVLCALDVSETVIDEAVAHHAHLIVAHHPLIFRGIKNVRTDTPLGHKLSRLLQANIAVIAAHTNLDIAAGGVNDVLAAAIGLEQVKGFVETGELAGKKYYLGRVGELPVPVPLTEFAERVRTALPTAALRFVRGNGRPIRKIALCSGSGAEFIAQAAALGVDAYLTGDVRYHDAQQAAELGLAVIDAGHFGTEFPVAAHLKKRLEVLLRREGKQAEVLADDASRDFFETL